MPHLWGITIGVATLSACCDCSFPPCDVRLLFTPDSFLEITDGDEFIAPNLPSSEANCAGGACASACPGGAAVNWSGTDLVANERGGRLDRGGLSWSIPVDTESRLYGCDDFPGTVVMVGGDPALGVDLVARGSARVSDYFSADAPCRDVELDLDLSLRP